MNEILQGDCLEVMKSFPDNHFSGVVTDPPYGLSFMGKGWDYDIPKRDIWKSCKRILKPGGFLLSMGGTRTYHRLACEIEEAGFDIRDTLMWLYGSGFPKSHNHFGVEGYGTALKPAYEPILLAMKPLDGTFKQNYEKWGVGGINIDACRVGTDDKISGVSSKTSIWGSGDSKQVVSDGNKKGGRWPANLLLDEESAEQLGPPSRFFYCPKTSSRERNEGLEDLPIGQTTVGGGTNNTEDDVCGKYGSIKAPSKNHHPTVKPLSLMRYLITLISPPTSALILDPFAGSGSTIIAAEQLGIQAIGIEKQADFCEIARARLKCAADKAHSIAEQMKLF